MLYRYFLDVFQGIAATSYLISNKLELQKLTKDNSSKHSKFRTVLMKGSGAEELDRYMQSKVKVLCVYWQWFKDVEICRFLFAGVHSICLVSFEINSSTRD